MINVYPFFINPPYSELVTFYLARQHIECLSISDTEKVELFEGKKNSSFV